MMPEANQDQTEIEKFNQLNHIDWWNQTGACSPLHQINPLRIDFIKQRIQSSLAQQNILDIGCGGGILCEALYQEGATVTGIDLSENAITIARQHFQQTFSSSITNITNTNINTIQYYHDSAENFAKNYRKNQLTSNLELFDIITCMEMLEHVPYPERIIRACCQLLKPGGHLFLSTLNRNIKSYLHAIIGAEWILKLLPKSTHDYGKFIRPSELSQWLRNNNFVIKSFKGIQYKILKKEYYLSDDISVNYLAHAQNI